MSQKIYADLHCHPAIRPLNLAKKTLWQTHSGEKIKKAIHAQLKGKRGALYDQSGYPKLVNGQVKLIFASLYPLEQGFMMNNGLFYDLLNIPIALAHRMAGFLNRFNRQIHLRDYFLALFVRFPAKRIIQLKKQEYWDGFRDEYFVYRQENDLVKPVHQVNIEEISALSKKRNQDFPINFSIKTQGSYRIADRNWDHQIPSDDTVMTVLTMEGMGIVSQTKNNAEQSRHGTTLENEATIFQRIQFLKEEIPLFFITFSHHFSTGLCGHARSFPDKARRLGILNQEYFIHENFSALGYRILQYLLAVKNEHGQWVRDQDAGRRILIDVKHMSLRGRMTLYQLVANYNQTNSDKIPIIASHVGFSGQSVTDMLAAIKRDGEQSASQIETRLHFGRAHTYNTWSINLGREEIGWIMDSGGLIGIALEQNNLGVAFGEKHKKKNSTFFTHLVMNQMLDMAKAAGSARFWKHLMMGTDFDGLIDPINRYSSALFFYSLRQDLQSELAKLSTEELHLAALNPDDLDKTLNDVFFQNAMDFLKFHFNPADMPDLSKPVV